MEDLKRHHLTILGIVAIVAIVAIVLGIFEINTFRDQDIVGLAVSRTSCNDTDNGKNYYVKGITYTSQSSSTDSCTGSTLTEYYCGNGKNPIAKQTVTCQYGCGDGICLSAPPDTTPPIVSITSPAAGSTVSGTISVSASASDNVGVVVVQFKLDGANLGSEVTIAPYFVNWDTTTASNGAHTLSATARDAAGNLGTASITVNVANNLDTTPPVVSNGMPSGTLPVGTTSATLQVSTDEAANCRYSTISGVAYASMPNTFSTIDGLSHSTTLSGLTDGTSYNYYVKCQDLSGNANVDDFVISFNVATSTSCPSLRCLYVDQNHPNANDNNAGTDENFPWKTLHRAVDAHRTLDPQTVIEVNGGPRNSSWVPAQAGDTVYVKNGFYYDNRSSITSGSAYTLTNSGTAGVPIAFRAYPGHRPVIGRNLIPPTHGAEDNPVIGGNRNYIIWDGFALAPLTSVKVLNGNNTIFENLYINKGSPGPGISWGTGNYYGIWIGGQNNIIRNNIIKNIIYWNSSDANIACIKMYDGMRTHIFNNLFENCITGIHDKEDGYQNIYEYNYFRNTSRSGIGTAITIGSQGSGVPNGNPYNGGTIIRYNVINSNNQGIGVHGRGGPGTAPGEMPVTNITIYSNTLWGGPTSTIGILINPPLFNITESASIYNNIIQRDINTGWSRGHIVHSSTGPSTGLFENYNLFYGITSANAVFMPQCCDISVNLATWQGMNYDINSRAADPLYESAVNVNSPSTDFKLRTGSPAIGAGQGGVTIGAYTTGSERIGPYWSFTPSDTTPPSVPENLRLVASSARHINITWDRSTDNFGVNHYIIMRDGFPYDTSSYTFYSDAGVVPSSTYIYQVYAVDAWNNPSAASSSLTASTTFIIDTTPPTVSITSPADGAVVNGTVNIRATASDDVGVNWVRYKIDGNLIGASSNTPPYPYGWNSLNVANGLHTIIANATDTSGNTAVSPTVTITVNN